MATWRAKCWLGSSNGYQELEVKSNTCYGAKEQFQRIYGAEQVINIREVKSSEGSGSSDISGFFPLAVVLFFIWVLIEYWYIVIPIALILGILIIMGMNDD